MPHLHPLHSVEGNEYPTKGKNVKEISYCCSADIYCGIGCLKTKQQVDELVEQYNKDRAQNMYNRATLSLITSTYCTEEGIEAMKAHGWEVLKTWASCHGDYPVTMFGLVRKPFLQEEYAAEEERIRIKKEENERRIAENKRLFIQQIEEQNRALDRVNLNHIIAARPKPKTITQFLLDKQKETW